MSAGGAGARMSGEGRPPPAWPAAFLRRHAAHPGWLAALPGLLADLAARWSLAVAPPYPTIDYNFVAPAERADGTPCVLKVSRYHDEARSEIGALRLWDGDGAARLLAADQAVGALLIERLRPGTPLAALAGSDEDAPTAIAAACLRQLWRPAPERHELRPLASWCAAYDRNRAALSRGAGGFPAPLFLAADALRGELLATTAAPVVLHGDLHRQNILRAERAPWLAIDPKGLAGDRCFDVCQFLRNPYPASVPLAVNRRRLDRFCADLGLDRERAKAWCFVHAILDACWSFEEGEPWERAVAYAEEARRF